MNLKQLGNIVEPLPISELSKAQLKELQIALNRLGFPAGEIDGLIGPRTRNAWSEFKTDIYQGNVDLIGPESIETLEKKLGELEGDRGYDFSSNSGMIEAIKGECRAQGIGLDTQIAYVIATTQWETAQTFKPVKEAYWIRNAEAWRKKNLRYYPYYGRGFVQLTWQNNYEKYSEILGVNLVDNPDLALDPHIALFVLVHGFKTGIFTGRKITDYIDSNKTDFVKCRRCINGTDRAHEIAQIAEKILRSL